MFFYRLVIPIVRMSMWKIIEDKELSKDILQLFAYYMLVGAFLNLVSPKIASLGLTPAVIFSFLAVFMIISVTIYGMVHVTPRAVIKYRSGFIAPRKEGFTFNQKGLTHYLAFTMITIYIGVSIAFTAIETAVKV